MAIRSRKGASYNIYKYIYIYIPLVAPMKLYLAQIVVAGTTLSKSFLSKKNCS